MKTIRIRRQQKLQDFLKENDLYFDKEVNNKTINVYKTGRKKPLLTLAESEIVEGDHTHSIKELIAKKLKNYGN